MDLPVAAGEEAGEEARRLHDALDVVMPMMISTMRPYCRRRRGWYTTGERMAWRVPRVH